MANAYCEKCDVKFKEKFAYWTEDGKPICPKCKQPVEKEEEEKENGNDKAGSQISAAVSL